MYYLSLFCSLFLLHVSSSLAASSFELAESAAQSGAYQLALARVEHDQPKLADAPLWFQWEALRLSLLAGLNRSAEVLERIEALPTTVPDELVKTANWHAARAALHLGRGAETRNYLARLLWQFEFNDAQFREIRRMVAQSYLSDLRTDDAYRVMLRYQQDFQPLSLNEAAEFTDGLLIAGAKTETATWLTSLDTAEILKLRVKLRSGLLTPDQAIMDARAALAPPPATIAKAPVKAGRGVLPVTTKKIDPAIHLQAIKIAAVQQGNSALVVEAGEQLLNQLVAENALAGVTVEELWQAYFSTALQQGNQAQLLLGDDAAWLLLGEQLQEVTPVAGRAVFAYLAVHAKELVLRESAQIGLAASLLKVRMDVAAIRLFVEGKYFPENKGLSPQVRFALGDAADQSQDYIHAAKLWRGLPQPLGGMSPEVWNSKKARVFVYGGTYAEASEAVQFMSMTHSAEQCELLFALGELAEGHGDAASAAGYYLRVAAQVEDGLAQQARLQAARNLVRAGLQEDAKRQYTMLLRTSKDAALQSVARRALARL